MAGKASAGSATTTARGQKVKELEVRKLDLLVKIRELQTELEKTNKALHSHGATLGEVLCW